MTIQFQFFGMFDVIPDRQNDLIEYLGLSEDLYLDLVAFNRYDEDGPVPILNLSNEIIDHEGPDMMMQTKLGYDRINYLIDNKIIERI